MSLSGGDQVVSWFEKISAERVMEHGFESVHLDVSVTQRYNQEDGKDFFLSSLACFNALAEPNMAARIIAEGWEVFLCFYIDEVSRIEPWLGMEWNWFINVRTPPELFVMRRGRGLFEPVESYRCAVDYDEVQISRDVVCFNKFQYICSRYKKDMASGTEFQRTFNVFM